MEIIMIGGMMIGVVDVVIEIEMMIEGIGEIEIGEGIEEEEIETGEGIGGIETEIGMMIGTEEEIEMKRETAQGRGPG